MQFLSNYVFKPVVSAVATTAVQSGMGNKILESNKEYCRLKESIKAISEGGTPVATVAGLVSGVFGIIGLMFMPGKITVLSFTCSAITGWVSYNITKVVNNIRDKNLTEKLNTYYTVDVNNNKVSVDAAKLSNDLQKDTVFADIFFLGYGKWVKRI